MNKTADNFKKQQWGLRKKNDDEVTEIYSTFSKVGRQNTSNIDQVLDQLAQNEYIGKETFDQFMAKKN